MRRRQQQRNAVDGRRSAANGFSLLEMIVAIALLGMAITGLISMINSSLAGAAMTREYERAAMLAKTQMNELLVMRPLPLASTLNGKFDGDTGWEVVVRPFDDFGYVESRSRLVEIKLTVWWQKEGERRQIEVDGYRRISVDRGPSSVVR